MLFYKQKTSNTPKNSVLIDQKELSELTEALVKDDYALLTDLKIQEHSPLYPLYWLLLEKEQKRLKSSEKALLDLNRRIQKIASISSIKDMVKAIQSQTDQINNLAAQAEEMSASATEIAESTNQAASFAEQSLNTASEGVRKVKEAISLVDISFTEFEQTNNQVKQVLQDMKEINDIVGLIAGVADQTNLLALNAAIEAARAGEQGRGFAVVAAEVQKLAEDTRSAVNTIKDKIELLNEESKKTSQSISQVAQNMGTGKQVMQHAESSIEEILKNTRFIADNIKQIASGNQQQSVTVQNFGQTITSFATYAESTLQYAQDAGQGIYSISEELISLRQSRVQQVKNLNPKQVLEIYKTDHICLTWRIYNMLLGYGSIDQDTLETADQCSLDKWLKTNADNITNSEALKKTHDAFHNICKQTIQAYQNKDYKAIDNFWLELSEVTKAVVQEIDKISESLSK